MRRFSLASAASAALLLAFGWTTGPARAADMPRKAPPAPAPIMPWAGFYAGGHVGGGRATRDVSYTPNDPLSALLISGTGGVTGEQPIFPNSFGMSGITGGLAAGYNWQFNRAWLVGVEADFSVSDIKGTGTSTSILAASPLLTIPQTVTEQQRIDWYGTVRARFGWLATDNLLLFATGGFAYGRVSTSGVYATISPPGTFTGGPVGGFSFSCALGSACFVGPSSSSTKTGWTAGAGAEWMFARRWSLKAEYQYVNLGSDVVTLTAVAAFPGTTPSSFTANFALDDFHVGRIGVNYHF
jgi:outer membrane immunogenic protein